MEEDEFLGNKFFVDTVLVIAIQWICSHEQINLQNGSRYVTENRYEEMTYFSFPRATWRQSSFCPGFTRSILPGRDDLRRGCAVLMEKEYMKSRKKMRGLLKYIPMVGLLVLYGLSLYRGAVTIPDSTERAIWIWKEALLINAALGLTGGMVVLDMLARFTGGRPPSIIEDLMEQDSKEFAVSYNGMVADSLFLSAFGICMVLYLRTNIHLLLVFCMVDVAFMALITIIRVLAVYFHGKRERRTPIISRLLDSTLLPMILCFLLLLVTTDRTVGFVYRNLQTQTNKALLILALMVILCYVPAIAFCHFSNLYCMTAFTFAKKDPQQIQAGLDALGRKNAEREDALREMTGYLDKKAEQVGFFRKIGLASRFLHGHNRAYWQGNAYAVSYLLLFGKLKITQRLRGLLEADRIRTNTICFCEIVVVLELLVLNMLLFIYLGSDDPCSRFFELLSTVIIIPILLSSLANLKVKKQEKG